MSQMSLEQLAVYFDQVAKLLGDYDFGPILEKLRTKLVASVHGNFEGAHDPNGEPWLPLKKSARKPLQRTGSLMLASIEAAWHSIKDESLVIDTNLLPFYWKFHQYGTRRIPARPFVGISHALVDEAEQMIVDDVIAKMKAAT